jgi:hypothetical protein
MTSQDLARIVWAEVIEENLGIYENHLGTPLERLKDPVWRRTAQLYARLDDEQRTALKRILRQAMMDTAATILAVLDGTCMLRDFREDFSLTYDGDPERINGDLSDYFLADARYNEDRRPETLQPE